jgi:RNA polymerase sigma factor (sigma-70 family)
MAAGRVNKLWRVLRRAAAPDGGDMTDGRLLERFVTRHDEDAFAALVRRHGPMVLGVCRRVLRQEQDAEDAFQATFLVLARRAASVGRPELLANWLYGVACRTAKAARRAASRRRAKERQVAEMPEPAAPPESPWHDVRPLLDEELSRLPDRYRVAVVLCDLEGKTRQEAARQLGWPEGSVSSRLARARDMLGKRLARRGIVPTAALLGGLASAEASAGLPPPLVSSTIRAATLLAAGPAAGAVPARVAALTEGVLRAMLLKKLTKVAVVLLLTLGALGFGGALVMRPTAAAEQGRAEPPPPEDKKDVAAAPERKDVAADKPAEAKDAASSPLTVTAEPAKQRVRVNEPFEVRLRVVNSSRSAQSFRVANGSWDTHWKSSNDRVAWVPMPVFRNFIETVKLDPGQAYEKTLKVFIKPGKPEKEVAFKMGFTPYESKQTYWSDEVTIEVEAGGG